MHQISMLFNFDSEYCSFCFWLLSFAEFLPKRDVRFASLCPWSAQEAVASVHLSFSPS